MDVRLSAEQRALRDSAALLVDRLSAGSVRDLDDRERSLKLDAAVDAAGWRELRTGDDDGEPWSSAVEVALVAEELGRGASDTSFLGPVLATELRRIAGAPAASSRQTVAFLPDLSEPARASDGVGVAIDSSGSETALLLTVVKGGWELMETAVPAADSATDLTRAFVPADLSSGAPVPGQRRPISDEELTRWTALGLAATCADLVGVMRGAIALTVGYAGTRRQFGAAIGSFQAVQHLMADAFVATEGSRSVSLHAAWAVDALAPDEALAAASIAKAYCARSARQVCETAIQVHGGIGNTWECFAHVYLRRALASSDLLGGVGASLARVLEHQGIGGGA